MAARIVSLHTGKPQKLPGSDRLSAIGKHETAESVAVTTDGLTGDVQADLRHHGGPFKAVCVYPREHYADWCALVGREMAFGSFGENFSTEGLLEPDVCLGDVWIAGNALLRVAGPRIPCGSLMAYWEHPGFHTTVRKSHKSGFYMSVEQEGRVSAGDELMLQERPFPDWTIEKIWKAIDEKEGSAVELRELLAIDALDEDWKRRARALLQEN